MVRSVDELACPLLRITLAHPSTNFAHFVQVGRGGRRLYYVSGDNPYLCHKVYVLELEGEALAAVSADGAGGGGSTVELQVDTTALPFLEAEGALLSIKISRDGKRLFANARPFADKDYFREFARMSPEDAFEAGAPDIVSEAQVQVWDLRSRTLLFRLDGHLGFTTKQCPHVRSPAYPPTPRSSAPAPCLTPYSSTLASPQSRFLHVWPL